MTQVVFKLKSNLLALTLDVKVDIEFLNEGFFKIADILLLPYIFFEMKVVYQLEKMYTIGIFLKNEK